MSVHFSGPRSVTKVISEVKRLKELEDENRRLKKMFAELSLQNEIIKEALSKKW